MTRYRIIYFVLALFCLASISRLVNLQVVKGDYYYQQSQQRLLKTSTARAPRGEIMDRKGKVLVGNETGFSVQIHYVKDMKAAEKNAMLMKLYKMVSQDEISLRDSFPVSEYKPYTFTIDGEQLDIWKAGFDIDKNQSADKVIDFFAKRYEIEGYGEYETRKLIGIRYEMESVGFSGNVAYTFAEDVSDITVTKIKEQKNKFPGVAIVTSPVRVYTGGNTAAHILGRVGKIYKDEYDVLKDEGYSLNDIIGKQGIEKIMESELRGTDGTSRVEQSVDGREVNVTAHTAAKQGNNVVLTIDADLQKAAEQAIVDAINYVITNSENEPGGAGYDADCGALVALDINTGEVLAMASYPDYNVNTFDEDYSSLYADPRAPMFNRAIGGAYEPGSTFKMVTAMAALQDGVIEPDDYIVDQGKYDFYSDYKPACWIYNSTGGTHGAQNVSLALENSCNYFFYDVGRRTGIESINTYAKLLGLGESTGIELSSEESTGRLTSPKLREEAGLVWQPGDTLQVSIGQSDNLFTPLQLANYVATIANGGNRYKVHLIKEVRSPETGEIISSVQPEILSKISLEPENRTAILKGMKNVVELGTASTVFDGFDIPIGGKTGTAEVAGGSDNAIFVAFAPYDKPTIAVCAVIEHGVHGSAAGRAVRAVLETYFHGNAEPETAPRKNTLTR